MGLIHISQLADRFVKDPNEVVKVHQRVEVTVVEVDLARKRLALSLRKNPAVGGSVGEKDKRTGPGQPTPAGPKPCQQQPANGWFSAALRQAKKG